MDYTTLHNKTLRTDPKSGEDIKDLLTLTFMIPDEYSYRLYTVTKEYIARMDLIALDQYGSTDYTDILCKLNGISNPYEVNEGQMIILPNSSDMDNFRYDSDTIESDSTTNEEVPVAKKRTEKRKTNEAVIGDSRFKIDKDQRVVIY